MHLLTGSLEACAGPRPRPADLCSAALQHRKLQLQHGAQTIRLQQLPGWEPAARWALFAQL